MTLPNQEPVERWELEFDEKFEGAICDGTGSFDRDTHEEIKAFISHQKALSRAEVLEEVKKYIENERIAGHMPFYSQDFDTMWESLSDTLAVVDELEGKK